jgi:hypothetical protein
VNKVEPYKAVLARNLLTKDDWRAALADEVMPVRPEVPLVSKPAASASRAERLARTGASPCGSAVRPPGAAEGVAPDPNAGEEVALGVPLEFVGGDVTDVPLIDIARRDVARGDQVAKPGRAELVDLVVVSGHAGTISMDRIALASAGNTG